MVRCIICEHRPASNGTGVCRQCAQNISAEQRKRRAQAVVPVKYIHYHGTVAAVIPSGEGTVKAVRCNKALDKLPKSKVIDLDHYCEGYTREIIKRFKAAVLKLAA